MPQRLKKEGEQVGPPLLEVPRSWSRSPCPLLAQCAPGCAVSRAFLFLLTLCMNANSSTAFKVFIFKSKEGRRRKRHAQPSQACVGGLGLIETPPAKRLESPSSPSPPFSCLLQAPKGASIPGDSLLLGEGLWGQGQRAWHPPSTRAVHPAPLRAFRHQTSLTPLP